MIPPALSITIIGHNEAYHLEELLPTLRWAKEIIYVDCESQDNSLDVAAKNGCEAYQRPNNPNLNINKAFAMEKASGEWIFYIDPDERIPENLANEIQRVITEPGNFTAFTLNRRNHYFGKWLKHGSQYPDTQLRLFQKGFAQFPKEHVHEKLRVDGKIGKLNSDLLHYPYLTISQYFHKFDFYTGFEANYMWKKGEKPGFRLNVRYFFIKPVWRFIRRYILKGGFLDGWRGFFAALFDSMNFVVRYFKLTEISEQKKQNIQ